VLSASGTRTRPTRLEYEYEHQFIEHEHDCANICATSRKIFGACDQTCPSACQYFFSKAETWLSLSNCDARLNSSLTPKRREADGHEFALPERMTENEKGREKAVSVRKRFAEGIQKA